APAGRTMACRRLRRRRPEPVREGAALQRSSWQFELTASWSDVRLHLSRINRREGGRLPVRRLILVDDHRPHPLIEVMAPHHAGHYAEFGAHALCEIECGAAPHLRQCELEACWRLCA